MDEATAVVAVSEFLHDKGDQFFIDSRYSPSKVHELPTRLDGCGLNSSIRIGRRIPDIIGYTDASEIFAIEIKGEEDIRKGIGQAAHYRQGVHKSMLAADASSLEEFEDTIISCGIGAYSIEKERDKFRIEISSPIENVAATELMKTQRALAIKTSDYSSKGSAFGSITMPLNAFLPVIALLQGTTDDSGPRSDCKDWIANSEHGVGAKTSNHALTLARTLQLITARGRSPTILSVTDTGRMGYYLLKGKVEGFSDWKYGIDQGAVPDSAADRVMPYIGELKKKAQYKSQKVYQTSPEIAAFLRDRYLAIPDVRRLTQVLASYEGSRAAMERILAEIALDTPEVFLNLFVKSDTEEEFREIMDDLPTHPENKKLQRSLIDIHSPDYLYNFLSHLVHTKILTAGTDVLHQEDNWQKNSFYWEWERDYFGNLAGDQI